MYLDDCNSRWRLEAHEPENELLRLFKCLNVVLDFIFIF